MLKVIKRILFFVITLSFSVISLAATCLPEDTDCVFEQKKMQLMDTMDIKPIATETQSFENKVEQPAKIVPFPIPKPESSQSKTDQDKLNKVSSPRLFPWVKSTEQPISNSQEQEASVQQPNVQEQQPVTQTPDSQPVTPSGMKYR